jgi:Uma2 family endonuclease
MATGVLAPISEYLRSAYRPDRDYVDGEIQERNLGELDHSDLQGRLLQLLNRGEYRSLFHANPELRVQVSTNRYRVPDICLRAASAPREQILQTAPLLCIEILSPEDRISRVRERVADFLHMGVREVWLVDAVSRTVSVCKGNSTIDNISGTLAVPGTPVTIDIGEIFSVLDE